MLRSSLLTKLVTALSAFILVATACPAMAEPSQSNADNVESPAQTQEKPVPTRGVQIKEQNLTKAKYKTRKQTRAANINITLRAYPTGVADCADVTRGFDTSFGILFQLFQ